MYLMFLFLPLGTQLDTHDFNSFYPSQSDAYKHDASPLFPICYTIVI